MTESEKALLEITLSARTKEDYVRARELKLAVLQERLPSDMLDQVKRAYFEKRKAADRFDELFDRVTDLVIGPGGQMPIWDQWEKDYRAAQKAPE